MCGIIGAISNSIEFQNDVLDKALCKMKYRGPDDSNVWQSDNKCIAFGHVRLSIVELSELGAQPMVKDGIVLVFNGEIYNYVELRNQIAAEGVSFDGNSDTEVLLRGYKLWGMDVLSKLNGVFSFSIYDSTKNKIFLARDRVGEKPLYYWSNNDTFYFASELTSLLTLPDVENVLDVDACSSYFVNGYTVGTKSLIKGINSVTPGDFISVDASSLQFEITSYWSLPPLKPNNYSDIELSEQLHGLLKDSLKLQLRCDVPACVLLSGGVDSSLLTALASQQTNRVKTFTVKFPGHSKFDESKSALKISQAFNTDHTEVEGVDIEPEMFLKIAQELDTPINDSSLLPTYLVNQQVAKYCRVALGGDGGDELFGGYKHYYRMNELNKLSKFFSPKLGLGNIKKLWPEQYRMRNWFECFNHRLDESVPNIRAMYDHSSLTEIFSSGGDLNVTNNVDWESEGSGHGSVIQNLTRADFNTYLRQSILVKSDRCSMLNSVEARAPILDYRIIEFAYRDVCDSYKIFDGQKKYLLKHVAKNVLPEDFDFDRKLGFNLPLGSMIRKGKWKQLFGDIFHSHNEFLDTDYFKNLFDLHQNGQEHTDRLFGAALFMEWYNKNNISVG